MLCLMVGLVFSSEESLDFPTVGYSFVKELQLF